MNYPTPKTMPCRDLDQLCPSVKAKALQLYKACKKAGIPIGFSQTYRSRAYQAELRKKLGTGAALPGRSMHEFRCAFDIYIDVKGKSYDTGMLKRAGDIGKKLGLTWGGDFPSVDMPHFQYTGKYTQAQIRAGHIPA